MRALTPHVGAYIELPVGTSGSASGAPRWPPRRGRRRASWTRATAACSTAPTGGALELLEVQPAGKRPMDAEAWIRGYGARLAGSR